MQKSSNGLSLKKKRGKNRQKTGKKWALFSLRTGRIRIFLGEKRALSSFAFPFFLAVFTVLQVHPKTRLSIVIYAVYSDKLNRGKLTLTVDKVTKKD